MTLLFAAFGAMNIRFLFPVAGSRPAKGILLVSCLFIVFALSAIAMQIRFRRRIITEFSYEGSALRFRTLGVPLIETRDLSEITDIRDWRGRGGSLGYRLSFRDGKVFYLEYSVSNATDLAERILAIL